MKTRKVKLAVFIIIIIFLMAEAFEVGDIFAEEKWVRYHGDFASFLVRWDFNLDFKKGGGLFTYYIEDPEFPGNKLKISYGHTKMEFKLPKKAGYKTQPTGMLEVENTRGVQYRGTTANGNNWREVYLYYSIKGRMGPDTRLIYVVYDEAPGKLSTNFNKVINSIKVNNPLKVEITPNYPFTTPMK